MHLQNGNFKDKMKERCCLSCVKKFTTENSTETKQLRLQSRLKES